MGNVVNLNRFRKAREKAQAQARAEANRTRHGRTKAEREAEKRSKDLASSRLDAHRREPADDGGDGEPAA